MNTDVRGTVYGGGKRSSMKRPKACREAELLPGVFAHLDSGDWRERLSGLEEVNSSKIAGPWELGSTIGCLRGNCF